MAILHIVDELANDDIDKAVFFELKGIITPITEDASNYQGVIKIVALILFIFFTVFWLYREFNSKPPIIIEDTTYTRVFEENEENQSNRNYRLLSPLLRNSNFDNDDRIITSQLLEINQDSSELSRNGQLNIIAFDFKKSYSIKFDYLRSPDSIYVQDDSLNIYSFSYEKTLNTIMITDTTFTLQYHLIE